MAIAARRALALLPGLLLVAAAPVLAASPEPSAASGDVRSSGSGAGLVGDPLLAIGLVVLVAVVSVGLTLAYVRLSGGAADQRGPR